MSAARAADDGDEPDVEPIFDELLSRALARIRGQHQIRETAKAEGMAPLDRQRTPPAPIGATWHVGRSHLARQTAANASELCCL
jgi:hypothetical protein